MNEEIVKIEGASYMEGFIAKPGVLCLLNDRIRFSFRDQEPARNDLEVLLPVVDHVDYFKSLSIIPNGITLMMKDGDMYHFVVDDRMAWIHAITHELNRLTGHSK